MEKSTHEFIYKFPLIFFFLGQSRRVETDDSCSNAAETLATACLTELISKLVGKLRTLLDLFSVDFIGLVVRFFKCR